MREESNSPDRRAFFRESLARILNPLGGIAQSPPPPQPFEYLRPPGAIPEREFLETCKRCSDCIAACPANAISWLGEPDELVEGTPVVDPDRAACVVCDGLLCTHVCPTGALRPLTDPATIRMGIARVDAVTCVRSRDEDCRVCVELCPMGPSALRLDSAGPPTVIEDGCVGCGVCQQHCPTSPKAIVVRRHRAIASQ